MSLLVSIIIPTYNRPEQLQTAIKHVLKQTYKNYELIIVDDGSKQPAEDQLNDINDKRLKVIRHEINKGLSAARNTGIQMAKGDWVALLDDDDFWLPEKLEHQLAYAVKHKSDVCICDYYDLSLSKNIYNSEVIKQKGLDRSILYWDGLIPSTWLVRRSVFDIAGDFDSSVFRTEDWDWMIRVYINRLNISSIPEVLIHYAGSHGEDAFRGARSIEQIAKKYRHALRKVAGLGMSCFLEVFMHQKIARAALHEKRVLLIMRHCAQALCYLLLAMLLKPRSALSYLKETIENNRNLRSRMSTAFKNWRKNKTRKQERD